MPRVPLALLVLLLAGCGDAERQPPPSAAESPSAAAVVAALEEDCKVFSALPPDQRAAAEPAFGPRLERDLAACRGTRYENVPLYLLAQWTMAEGGDEAPGKVLGLLERLDRLPSPAYRQAGRVLRVQALLATGQAAAARRLAVELEEVVPQLGAMAHVVFHDQVGTRAPAIPGVRAGGPAAAGDGMLLVVFTAGADAYAARQLAPWRALAGASGGRLRLVVVALGGDLLAAGAAAQEWGCEVRWVRPDAGGQVAPWHLPGTLPAAVLLAPGAEATILAANPSRAQVRQALGLH